MSMTQIIKVIGIDPSLAHTGLCKVTINAATLEMEVEDLVLIKTEKSKDKRVRASYSDYERAREIHRAIQLASMDASLAIAEMPQGSQSARAAASYGVCIGVLSTISLPLIQVSPIEVKLATVGKKTASKEQMIDWAMTHHPDAPWLYDIHKGAKRLLLSNEHLADAVAAVAAGIKTDQFQSALSMMHSMKAA